MSGARVVGPDPDNHYAWGQRCDGWRLADDPELSVIEERMPPGAAERRHVHERARRVFRVLEGALAIELEDATLDVPAGRAALIPPGLAHCVRNEGASDARFLVISSPTTCGDRTDL